MGTAIRYEDDQIGGRLVYYRAKADQAYWDERWESATDIDYGLALRGKLEGWQDRMMRRWAPAGCRVLEAGCGMARFTVACHVRGYDACGLDWAPKTVERLRERFPKIGFETGDVRKPPYPDESFDVVFSPGVCEHFSEGPEDVLAGAFRVLRPGGVALVSAPYFNPLRQHLARHGRFADGDGDFYQYAFSAESLTRHLERVGFEVEAVQPAGTFRAMKDHRVARFDLIRSPFRRPAAAVVERLPVTRQWGHIAVWVARRP